MDDARAIDSTLSGLKLILIATAASSGVKSMWSISSIDFDFGAVAGCESKISRNCSYTSIHALQLYFPDGLIYTLRATAYMRTATAHNERRDIPLQ